MSQRGSAGNSDAARAFIDGAFVEEGYTHRPTRIGKSPAATSYRFLIALLVFLPQCAGLAVAAYAWFWWTVEVKDLDGKQHELAVRQTANIGVVVSQISVI